MQAGEEVFKILKGQWHFFIGRLSAAEVVDVVYVLVMIGGAENVRNGVCVALASKSGWPETEGEDSAKVKQILPAVTKETVIFRINRNLTVSALQVLLVLVTSWALGNDGNDEVGGTREREVKRLVEEGVFRNPIVHRGACGEAKVQNNASFKLIFRECLKRWGLQRSWKRVMEEWASGRTVWQFCL